MSKADKDFLEFHTNNPTIYHAIVALARKAKERGYKQIGIGLIWEVMRWEMMLSTIPNEGDIYKINNNYRPRYARLVMEQEPDLAGIFKIRTLFGADS